MSVYVLDASTVIEVGPEALRQILSGHMAFTVPVAVSEIDRYLDPHDLNLRALLEDINSINPDEIYIQRALEGSRETGDAGRISKTDLTVVALALQLAVEHNNVVVLSEDYSIQNLCNHLGIMARGLAHETITEKYRWIYVCMGCKRRFEPDKAHDMGFLCPFCGKELRPKRDKRADGAVGEG